MTEVVDVPWSQAAYGRTRVVAAGNGVRSDVPNEDGIFTPGPTAAG